MLWYNNNVLICCVTHLRCGNVSGGPKDEGQQSANQLPRNRVYEKKNTEDVLFLKYMR